VNRAGDPALIGHCRWHGDPLSSSAAEPSVMHMAMSQYFTPDMVRQLPDDGMRYETVHGELLVTPAPRLAHQQIVRELLVVLDQYCKDTGIGGALTSPADVSLARDSLVQPDVFVHPPVAGREMKWEDLGRPLLVAEVLSPGTARADRFTKRVHYQRAGVPVYWIVDESERLIEVWTPDATEPVIERNAVGWFPDGAGYPLRLPLERIFGPAT
jgi:Uma2 family endonuclease